MLILQSHMFGWPSLSNVFCCVQQGLGPQTLVCVYKLVIVHPCDCDASLMASCANVPWHFRIQGAPAQCWIAFLHRRCDRWIVEATVLQCWCKILPVIDCPARWYLHASRRCLVGQVACCWFKVGPCIECIDDIHIDVYLYAHICTIYVCINVV